MKVRYERVAGPGQHQHAATVARSITNPDRQAQTLATVAEALAARGRNETGAPRGFGGVCRRTVDNGADAGVVAGTVGGQSVHRPMMEAAAAAG